jgi:hypothetical protein
VSDHKRIKNTHFNYEGSYVLQVLDGSSASGLSQKPEGRPAEGRRREE